MFNKCAVLAFAVIAFSTTSILAADKKVELLTLEWPPYTASALPGGGATTSIVRTAFEAAGYQVKVSFVPWKRAVEMVATAPEAATAFFPGYHCKQKEGLLASEVVGDSPIGFAQATDAPLGWTTLDDLKEKRIGTVLGYSNTPEFDARVADGRIRADVANDDLTNLRKLTVKRIDAAVVDKFVFEFLRKTEGSIADSRDKLAFNPTVLQNNPLYVCARDDGAGRDLIRDLNAGLKGLDITTLTKTYFDKAL